MYFCLILIYILIGYLQQTYCTIHCTDKDYPLIPFKVRADLGNLNPAANIRNHAFCNLVCEEGHQLPTIFSRRLCYQHFTTKSSLERINTLNTKRLELLETKLRIIDLFNNTYENNC